MALITGPIQTEAEYEAALEEVEAFFDDLPRPGTPRGDRFELLALLIEKYEDKHHAIPEADLIKDTTGAARGSIAP